MEAEILNELKILTDLGFELETLYIVEEGGLVFTEEDMREMAAALERGDLAAPMPEFQIARQWYDAWLARNPAE